MSINGDPKEVTLDWTKIAISRRQTRIAEECRRRIEGTYPMWLQTQIIAASVASKQLGQIDPAVRAQIQSFASELPHMVRFISLHQMAAQLMVRSIDGPNIHPNDINPADDMYWPDQKHLEDKAWVKTI